jgi:hypothetical protein
VIFTAFKAVDSVLRGPNGGFDSHTLPPDLSEVVGVGKIRGLKAAILREEVATATMVRIVGC